MYPLASCSILIPENMESAHNDSTGAFNADGSPIIEFWKKCDIRAQDISVLKAYLKSRNLSYHEKSQKELLIRVVKDDVAQLGF
jgi:hypothetical protein